MTVSLRPLPPSESTTLASARPGPELAAVGYTETEYVVSGEARSYRGALPVHGRASLTEDVSAPFTTRVVVRRPSPTEFSGTLVAEWLNVSSGQDAPSAYTYLADEIVRRGHAWVGVSAQFVGIEGGSGSGVMGDDPLPSLRAADPERYADLHHPGDAFAFDLFTRVVRGLVDEATTQVLAVGQSQSAFLLTTYLNGVQPREKLFDGFLLHSRCGAAAPLGAEGAGHVVMDIVQGAPTLLRDDTEVPVIVVQTETDFFSHLAYLPARQPDSALRRTWEVAGSAHADKHLIGPFEEFLGCPEAVNTGQQSFVLKAALRHLDAWARGGSPAPSAPPLGVVGTSFVTDENGNTLGGVRTPCVDVPAQVLSGSTVPEASYLCRLFGSSRPLPDELVCKRYVSVEDYLEQYAAAAHLAIAAGFVLAEDREALLAEARPDLVSEALTRAHRV